MAGTRNPATTTADGRGRRFALIVARFHEALAERLREGAVETLTRHGVDSAHLETIHVPGAFELPLAAQMAAQSGRFDAVITLGVVIRGGTDHYQFVCAEAARGVMAAGLSTGVPVLFGVLTCDDEEQARARAGGNEGNKGAEAAIAALEIVQALAPFRAR